MFYLLVFTVLSIFGKLPIFYQQVLELNYKYSNCVVLKSRMEMQTLQKNNERKRAEIRHNFFPQLLIKGPNGSKFSSKNVSQ
jgi:hypothetical protein